MRGSVAAVSGDVDGDDAGVRVAEDAGPVAVAGVRTVSGGPRGENAGGVGKRRLYTEERGFVRIDRNGVVLQREEDHEDKELKLHEGIPFDH